MLSGETLARDGRKDDLVELIRAENQQTRPTFPESLGLISCDLKSPSDAAQGENLIVVSWHGGEIEGYDKFSFI